MNTDEHQLKQQMCEIGSRSWQRGFCAGNEGNHSIRIGSNRILCTPTCMSKGFLEVEDICVIDMQGNLIEANTAGRQPTSEILIHLAIYKAMPGVSTVVHAHPPHAVAFCLANMPLPERVHPEAELFLGKTVFAEYATPGSSELPASFLDKLTDETTTILLANHGSISLGRDITEAYLRLEILDNYCKQLILAKQLGRINVLTNDQMADLFKAKQKFGFTDSRSSNVAENFAQQGQNAFLASFPDHATDTS